MRRLRRSSTAALSALAISLACAEPSHDAARETAAARAANSIARAGGTYFLELLAAHDRVNYRWPDRRREPVLVWIQPATQDSSWVALAKQGFSDWEQLELPILFAFTSDSASAAVHLRWVARFDERMTGLTTIVHDSTGWISGATIVLAQQLPDGRPNTADGIRAIARHEVGHLLGLDHTRDTSSVMASPTLVTKISEADRRTVRLVYSLPAGRVQ